MKLTESWRLDPWRSAHGEPSSTKHSVETVVLATLSVLGWVSAVLIALTSG